MDKNSNNNVLIILICLKINHSIGSLLALYDFNAMRFGCYSTGHVYRAN